MTALFEMEPRSAAYSLLLGDCIEVMKTLPANSVQTCVTSPPYYGLRDYGTAAWDGGDADCNHVGVKERTVSGGAGKQYSNVGSNRVFSGDCACGARRIDSQIGLEPTPDEYVAKLVEVFREVRRLLRDDGTLWLNLGDSYNGSGGAGGDYGPGGLKEGQPKYPGRNVSGLKPKDLIGIPWMVSFALRADGWWLRSDIIWEKPNPMPESVTDRPTKAHEYIFLLSKSAQYFYDADAVAEPIQESTLERYKYGWNGVDDDGSNGARTGSAYKKMKAGASMGEAMGGGSTRNRRSVWTVATQSYDGAHFATYPVKLIEPCILAGTSAYGCCAACGAPWARVVEEERTNYKTSHYANTAANGAINGGVGRNFPDTKRMTTGWQPTCTCNAEVVPCTVLDPFSGSGTTGAVALKHGRKYIGCELNPDYIALAVKRIESSQPMLFEVTP